MSQTPTRYFVTYIKNGVFPSLNLKSIEVRFQSEDGKEL